LGLVLVLALGVFAAACGSSTTTTTAATTATTAAPGSTETTAATTATTAAPGSTETTASANTNPINIGIAISLTGDSAAPCTQIKEGFDTEAAYINSNGGINGRKVNLVYVDDQSKMDTATAAIQKLIDQKVDVIIGPFPDFTQPATFPLTEKAQILQIAFGPPTLDMLSKPAQFKYSFSPATGPDGCADAFVKEMQADGHKNVLGIADQLTISGATLKTLATTLPAAGVTFTAMSDTYSLSETDFNPIANKIAAKAKDVKPDAIILCSNPVAVNPLTKALRALGVKVPIYNQGSAAHPLPMFKGAGNDPAVVAGDYAIGPAIVDPSQVPDTYTAKQDLIAYVARWKAGAGAKEAFASLFLGFSYDTIHLAEQAIKSATDQTPAGYAAAMEKVDWWGAQGHYVFSATDHIGNHGGFFQWQYTNGQGFKLIRDLNALSAGASTTPSS
jgi:branched-chain amino acid transport system substrate-binding protein